MNCKPMRNSLAISLAACLIGLGIAGCGGGKDDPTSVALRPPKGELGGGGGNGGGPTPETNGGPAPAGGYGGITGRIVIPEGERANAPPLKLIKFAVGKAPAQSNICAIETPIYDESLLVNPMNGGIENVFIYLNRKPAGGKDQIESQSDWPTAEEGGLVLNQKNCTFSPHAMIVLAGEEFTAKSEDPTTHSYKGSPKNSPSFNDNISANEAKKVKPYRKAESYPVSISCSTHGWMQGYQLPLDHPYGVVTDADGKFRITDLPAGQHDFVIWHEKGGKIMNQKVTVKADEDTDLGDITISLSQLK